MAAAPDPVLTPWRPDLAAAHLRGAVEAERFVEGTRRQAARGIVPMRGVPDDDASMTTELLFGEAFTVYEERDGWAWGQAERDGYVGYVRADRLTAETWTPTHKVTALRAFLYPAPDFKRPPLKAVSLGGLLTVVGWEKGYAALAGEGWISGKAIAPVDTVLPDPVATAMRFLGVPYLWGGRSSLGLDCSGLVQVALQAAGIPCPRDSHMQEAAVGAPVAGDAERRRGDLVFFPGHVGLMADAALLLHANVAAMCVSLDPLAEIEARVQVAEGRGITAVRRLGG